MARPKKATETKEVKPSEVLRAGFTPLINPIPSNPGPKIINVYSVRCDLWHPFQKRMIPVNDPVPVIIDGWLESQMKAGHIKEI